MAEKKTTLRSYLKWIYILLLYYTGTLALAKRWVLSKGAIVLTFHRVLSDSAAAQTCSPAGLIMKRQTFEALLKFLKDNYLLVDLGAGIPAATTDRIPVAITFDDGWEDNVSTAFPIVSALKVPITIFICPELIDTPMPFWPEQIIALFRSAGERADGLERICSVLTASGYPEWAMVLPTAKNSACDALITRLKSISTEERRLVLKSLLSCGVLPDDYADGTVDRTMSWSQISELQKAAVTFGSHTLHHEILTVLPANEAEREIRESKAAIDERVNPCSLFSYPNGDASPALRHVVARCGYEHAFINSPGVWRKQDDPLLIPRINLSEGTVTGPNGTFSRRAFEHRVFWNAFMHRRRARQSHRPDACEISAAVEKFNTL